MAKSNAPSTKVIVPGIVGAIATLTIALVQHNALDPRAVAVAITAVVQAGLAYLTPHKPVTVKPVRRRSRRNRPIMGEFATLYDTTTPTALGRVVTTSTDAALAAYDDGRFRDINEMRRDFPGHRVYSIAVFARDDGDFLDVEPGDANGAEACDWIEHRRAVGARFIGIYADATRWGEIFAEANRRGMSLHGEPGKHVGVCKWIADPTGVPHIPKGYEGCQWGWPGRGTSANFDQSLFYAHALR